MTNDSRKTLDAIRRMALEDLDATTDEELRAEAAADGRNLEAVARSVATELDAIVSAAMRRRTSETKTRTVAAVRPFVPRPALDRMKALIEQAFRTDPRLATAFREGTRQTESDLQSLYDDLVRLGKIEAHEQ